jgi:hypothetical protein
MPNRIIKESIWTSPNLNKLDDQAELLFYRILPLPDDHGCFEADPDIIKGKCFPKKKNWTNEIICRHLTTLAIKRLVSFWVEKDRLYGFFHTWTDHQRIRSLHNRKTPEPKKDLFNNEDVIKFMLDFDDSCRQLAASDRLNPNPNPNPIAFTKVKAPKKSGHFSNQLIGYAEEIIKCCNTISKLPQKHKGQKFNPFQWVQFNSNGKMHPGAILETVEALANPKYWNDIKGGPWAYATAIIKTKNGNWNERTHINEAKKFKQTWISPEVAELLENIGVDNEPS